jgi:hypothetical protein
MDILKLKRSQFLVAQSGGSKKERSSSARSRMPAGVVTSIASMAR